MLEKPRQKWHLVPLFDSGIAAFLRGTLLPKPLSFREIDHVLSRTDRPGKSCGAWSPKSATFRHRLCSLPSSPELLIDSQGPASCGPVGDGYAED